MRRFSLCVTLLLVAIVGLADRAVAQINGNGEQTLRVFLDCGHFCDFDHFRRSVTFVDYVRDRQDARVHVLVTRQETGGGTEFSFTFIGLQEFAGRTDTLVYRSSSTDTGDERREGMVQTFRMGLMPFVAATPIARRIQIGYQAPDAADHQDMATPETDPWNFWIFSTSLGGWFQGRSLTSSLSLNASANANRTTEEWKILIRANGRYSRDRYTYPLYDDNGLELPDTAEIEIVVRRNYSAATEVINSLTTHWSTGVIVSGNNSSFQNTDLRLTFSPAIEYNVFPYSESTRRQLTVLYRVGFSHYRYAEETVFGHLNETRPITGLEVDYEVRQPWGSAGASIEASAYLHDLARHRLELYGDVSLRVVRGLELNFFGSFSRIKDQIFLPATAFSSSDVLTGRFELGTDYEYFGNFSIRYTFGSIFNNVVNPRMRGL